MMPQILKIVAEHYGLSEEEILCQNRETAVRHPRQIAMYFMTKGAHLTYESVARYFGKHHSTVVHAVQVVKARISRDETLAQQILEIEAKIPAVPIRLLPVRVLTPLPNGWNFPQMARAFRQSRYAFEPVDAQRLAVSPGELDRMLAEFGTKVARMMAETTAAGG